MSESKKFTKITRTTKYKVNGKEYDSLDEAPEEYRKLLRDANGDGTPGVVQGRVLQREVKVSYEHNGQKYSSLDEMPPGVRAFFEGQEPAGQRVIQGCVPPGPGESDWASEETRLMPQPGEAGSERTSRMVYKGPVSGKLKYVVAAIVAVIIALVIYYVLR